MILITHSLLSQETYYKLYSNGVENICSGISVKDDNIFLSQILGKSNLLITAITKFDRKGNYKTKIEYPKIDPTKFNVFGYDYAFNRLKKFINNFIVSGHEAGKDQDTKFHIFNSDLEDQMEFSITSTNAERIGNEGIYVEDSILYSYGLLQKENVLYANIVKYNLNTNTIIWDKNYKKGKRLNQMWDFQKTHDGNYIFIMYHKDADAGSASNSGYQITTIDSNGNILDTFNYDDPSVDKQRILSSKEGAIYFTTENNLLAPIIPSDGRINKLSKNMDTILWSLELPSNAFTNGNRYKIYDYIQANNGDILACGTVWHMPGGPLVAGPNATWNGFVARVSQQGELKWSRIYRLANDNPQLPNDEYGNFRAGQLDKIIETEDGNFVLGGTAYYSSLQHAGLLFGDTLSSLWLMVVDENGCIEGGECGEVIHLDSKVTNSISPKLVNDKVSWVETEYSGFNGSIVSLRYKFSNDSFQYEQHYYRELLTSDEEFGNNFVGLKRYFREDNNKIFEYINNEELLMYDFNLALLDTINIKNLNSGISIPLYASQVKDSITLENGEKRKSLEINCKGFEQIFTKWIEGIGSTNGFLSVYESCSFDINVFLTCFYINDNLVYRNPDFNNCWTTSTEEINMRKFAIVPNPSRDKISIIGDIEFDNVNVYTAVGTKMNVQKNGSTIDVSNLIDGLYIIELERKGQSIGKQKFVKIE